jgi:hypothetical protein
VTAAPRPPKRPWATEAHVIVGTRWAHDILGQVEITGLTRSDSDALIVNFRRVAGGPGEAVEFATTFLASASPLGALPSKGGEA